MDYIVFDLEWNQSPNGKQYSNQRLPFEIIEIGAVRVNSSSLEIKDSFHTLVRPSVYHWIHNSIHDVTHMNYRDLADGLPFPDAVRSFLKWCGEDFAFCTWGTQDLMELQRNMDYYRLLNLMPAPVVYVDVQMLFARLCETRGVCRSLEYAIDFLNIEKEHGFHRALSDAQFTAEILCRFPAEEIPFSPSLDVYQHPAGRKEEYHIDFPDRTVYVSREFPSREKAMKDREVTSTRCPLCGHNARRTLRWFSPNGKICCSISSCQTHGEVTGYIRFMKTGENSCFAVKSLRCGDEEEAAEIRRRREALRMKRRKKPRTDP